VKEKEILGSVEQTNHSFKIITMPLE